MTWRLSWLPMDDAKAACWGDKWYGVLGAGDVVDPTVPNTVVGLADVASIDAGDGNTCAVLNALGKQSQDIAQGVDRKAPEEQGAGDQGLMFGFACDETPELMPLPISLSHHLVKHLSQLRKEGVFDFLRPDSKSQVTVQYEDGKPVAVRSVVISTQHSPEVSNERLREAMIEQVAKKVIPQRYLRPDTEFHINPTGRFVVGGPMGDCGLTGRKIIVDTYGGMGRHGGGAFSGKDPSKVDRSAAYAARWVAKNIVAAGLAERCEVQVAYAIGVAHPVSVMVETFGTNTEDEGRIAAAVREVFDLRPASILEQLDLRRPVYRPTAAYGHFGRDQFTWERTDKVDALRAAI